MPSARYGALFLVEPLVWLTTSFGWLHRGGRLPETETDGWCLVPQWNRSNRISAVGDAAVAGVLDVFDVFPERAAAGFERWCGPFVLTGGQLFIG